ncbi:MAG: hypothetical protein QNJ97_17960 [Myxococcota bacterium]|nr:hypothetical protein [Myxococcota bacterium]
MSNDNNDELGIGAGVLFTDAELEQMATEAMEDAAAPEEKELARPKGGLTLDGEDMSEQFRNENYHVLLEISCEEPWIRDGLVYDDLYYVVNNHTGAKEYKTPVLPEALAAACQFDISLQKEMHLSGYEPTPPMMSMLGALS